MKRLAIIFIFLGASVSAVMAADVRVKRLDGGDSPNDNSSSKNGSVIRQGGGRDQGASDSKIFRGKDNDRGGWRGNDRQDSRSRGQAGHGPSVQSNSSKVTLGVGHTRIIRQSGTIVPDRHESIAGNSTIVRSIEQNRKVEIVPNHQYWHNNGGSRYVHTYRGGIHWYGFYHGPNFYWTRYYQNRWWWYDDGFAHWVFWWGGRWWWNGPGGRWYVCINDSYYPYDEAPVNVTPPSASGPAPEETENNGGAWTSRDGKRMVQIHGPQAEAFLYDNSGQQPTYLAYLGKNVERVRFSGGTDGKPLRVLVDFKNGDFTLFSGEGEPFDLTPPDAPADESVDGPPNPPTDLPKE